MKRMITRNVYLLGLISLFNDFSSDMIAPLLPAFLASMGLGAGFLGIMEGVANSLSHLMALFSGWLDDRLRRSKGIAMAGYWICTVVRPVIAVPIPGVTMAVRFLDRIGKGIRTAPRDRLITDSMDKKNWGKAFGVQRALDHTGALIGPPIAALLLKFFGLSYSALFLVAAIPAFLSMLIIPWGIREPENRPAPQRPIRISWSRLPSPLRRYLLIIFLVAFSTPSELFLILKVQDLGLKAYYLPLVWGLLTLASLLAAYLGGILSDRWSQRRTIALGWTLFVLVYVAFAYNNQLSWSWALIALYGFQAGLVEAPERSYPASVVPPEIRASAMGWYYFAYGLGLLPASLLFGLLWSKFSSATAFLVYAGMTLIVIPLLGFLPTSRHTPEGIFPLEEAALR